MVKSEERGKIETAIESVKRRGNRGIARTQWRGNHIHVRGKNLTKGDTVTISLVKSLDGYALFEVVAPPEKIASFEDLGNPEYHRRNKNRTQREDPPEPYQGSSKEVETIDGDTVVDLIGESTTEEAEGSNSNREVSDTGETDERTRELRRDLNKKL